MYVEYDSVRDFFFLAPPAFLGAFADFLEGVLAILCFFFPMCWSAAPPAARAHISEAPARRYFLATNEIVTLVATLLVASGSFLEGSFTPSTRPLYAIDAALYFVVTLVCRLPLSFFGLLLKCRQQVSRTEVLA